MADKTLQATPARENVAIRNNGLKWANYLADLEKRFSRTEPEVRAFLEEKDRFKRLRNDASELERAFPTPDERPALYGLLVGVKDIFRVEGFETRAGSQLPPDELAGPEADAVTSIRNAGALIMGKTVTTEFAYFNPGPTRNPHNLEHTPGGSSSGSAAAVAAGMLPLAFGTQTIGSISRPASFCGVIGYKPSYDRISRAGAIPLSPTLDHVGFFAKNLKLISEVGKILGLDWCQPANCLARPRVGIINGPYLQKADPDMLQHFLRIISKLSRAGYEIKHLDALPHIDEIAVAHITILAAEAAQVHKEWYSRYSSLYHQKTQELIERGRRVPSSDLLSALKSPKRLRDHFSDLMAKHRIDVWISPSAKGAAPKGLGSTGDPIMNLPWTHSGLPTISLPAGKNQDGMPLGLQIAAGWYEDERLTLWAEHIETDIAAE